MKQPDTAAPDQPVTAEASPPPTPMIDCPQCNGTGFYCRQPCCGAHRCGLCKGSKRVPKAWGPGSTHPEESERVP